MGAVTTPHLPVTARLGGAYLAVGGCDASKSSPNRTSATSPAGSSWKWMNARDRRVNVPRFRSRSWGSSRRAVSIGSRRSRASSPACRTRP
jgi:hypothetical protein